MQLKLLNNLRNVLVASNTKQYGAGEVYKIFNRKGDKLLLTLTIPETMCKAGLDRLLFFKHNIPPGEYTAKKVSNIGR
ncbi:hypothetical protein vBEcoMRo121lw_00098 [Escherichia phage vB_EcoM-Ro121lw]|uniref:Uncharacterized protein n=1 Tax=Escherichia phage vB_EcoM-Ro121lw TaxID=2178929 RepID=A0A494RBH7_9CAUD|nr:hypothetical protein vBEcoMRo121lw_00098 [Escherichia phage vB_EcoM-Ro121lw]UGV23985.1 hypothetical protein [Escherichia phage BI-EHEC]